MLTVHRTIYVWLMACLLMPWTGGLAAARAAPQIQCEISVASWCIAPFDGEISMKDDGAKRIWTLQANDGVDNEPMTIVESKSCSDHANEQIKLIQVSQTTSANGAVYSVTTYELNSNGCTLKFTWMDGKNATLYKQVMRYGILVGYGHRTQLYKISKSGGAN